MSFLEIAALRNITVAEPELTDGTLGWDVEPDAYQRLRVPPGAPIEGIFRLMARRGLEPALVTALLAVYPARPIERALIAYDALGGSLLGDEDGALADQLLIELASVKAFASELAAVPHAAVGALIAAVHGSDDFALPSLAGLVDLADDAAARDAIFAHVRLLARAKLGSLALGFLQILFDRFALPRALEQMVEVALDHDALGSLPPMPGQDDASMRLQSYLVVRASLIQYDLAGAARFLAALEQHPGVAGSAEPRLLLVKAQLATMRGETLDPPAAAEIAEISNADLEWRYAQAVADAVEIADAPESTVARLESYLTTFGNDARVWGQALLRDNPDVTPALAKLLARELRYGSHEPDVWRALSALSDNTEISDEVDRRLAAQLHAALTS